MCASATWRARSWVSALAPGPAISRASVSTSSDNAGLEQTGRLSAWRSAFLAARARPWAVLGPVLARAFARLALILRSLVQPISSFGWRRLDRFKLAVLDLLYAASQRFAEDRPTPIDLVQAGVAAALGDGG